MKPIPSWARWLLVLPVAVVIDLIAQSALHALSSFLTPESLEPFANFLAWQGLAPLVFVAGGVIVAPQNKFLMSIVLGGFKAVVAIYNAHITEVYAFIRDGGSWNAIDSNSIVESPVWWNMSVYAFCIFGLIGLSIFVKKDEIMQGEKVRKTLGGFFKICGAVEFFILSLWGFILSLRIVNEVAGFWGCVVGFTIAPNYICRGSLVCRGCME